MSKLVFVYSIPRETASRVDAFVNDSSGKQMKKTKIGRTTDAIRAMYSPQIGGLANYISYTPWIGDDGLPVKDDRGNTLMLQDKLEQKYGLPKGYLHNRPWRNGESRKEEDLSYYTKKSWRIKDGCTVFDMSDMDQELGYYVMLASSFVANSEREWLSHKWPKAKWYIALENESDDIKYTRTQVKLKAFAALDSPDLTDVYKRKLVTLLGISNSKTALTNQQVNNFLYEFIDKSTSTPGSNIEKFNNIISLLKTPSGREEFEARFILAQAIDTGVVKEKQDTYTFLRPTGPIVIGDRYSEAVDFILNPKKSSEVEDLQAEIAKKL